MIWKMRCNCSRQAMESSRSEEHTSELQSHSELVCRLLLEKKQDGAVHRLHHPARTGAMRSRDPCGNAAQPRAVGSDARSAPACELDSGPRTRPLVVQS